MNWHSKQLNELSNFFKVDFEKGLSEKEAEIKITKEGKNKLAEKKKDNIVVKFFEQFNDFMIIVLLAAAGISVFTSVIEGKGDFIDPIIIVTIVILNAVLGLVQENKAEKAIEALKRMTAANAKVMRDGKLLHIPAEDLVCGDIIILETGDYVPADARLISSINLKIEESALTGESLPVEKDYEVILKEDSSIGDKRNMVFSGSSVCYGRGKAVVIATGMNTEVGKIADMIISDESPETPLQKKLSETGKILGIAALSICAFIFLIGVLRRIPPFDMFMTSLSLAVAAIPEGLPAIVTIMLAIGVQRMTKKNAVVKKLPAVETLGSASVICSDKTGTLTQNKMKVVEISDGSKILNNSDKQTTLILRCFSLCNDSILEESLDAPNIMGDPTETALVHAAFYLGINKNKIDREAPRVGEVPFDSKRKLMTTVHKNKASDYMVITKGAPDFLLDKCSYYYENGEKRALSYQIKQQILTQNELMADKALRVLGVAFKEESSIGTKITTSIENNLIFCGLVGMIDPPREEVKEAVALCKTAGIRVCMVTGDHISTAIAVARKIGIMSLKDKAITGEEISKMSFEELCRDIYLYNVFARVSPEHKVRIVKAFQSNGAIVAMTGDGVNDAPALKAADIGCAMGINGTDVAKGASDMVLTDDNFATIVEAVKEGRGIYANIKKAVHFLLSSNIGEIITILVAIVLGWKSPLLAIHLLWVNLVTDSLPAIALGLDPSSDDTMHNKPIDNHKSMFSGGLGFKIALEGCMIGMLAIVAFGIGVTHFDSFGRVSVGRTMAFAVLSISQLVHAFNMRSEKSLITVDLFSNMYLIFAFIAGLVLQVSVIMIEPLAKVFKVVPLSPEQWIVVAFLSLLPIIFVELEKFLANKGLKREVVKVN